MIKAIVLSGGATSILLPLTINTPKSLLPVGNIPLILFQLHRLKEAGISDIILSLSFPPRQIRQILDDGTRFGLMLRYHVESTPLGTAGAFKAAANLIDDTTVIINGDILTEASFPAILESHRDHKAMATIAVHDVTNPRSYGSVETRRSGQVTRFIERPRGSQVRTNTINAGIYVLEPQILEWIPEDRAFFFENDLFPLMLEKKAPFFAFPVEAYWSEITRPDNYHQCNMDFLEGRITAPHFAVFPKWNDRPRNAGLEIDDLSVIDENCIIKPGARIERSVLGARCRVDSGVTIRNSVLWPACQIDKGASITGSILGRGCVIGENASVHTGRILGDKSSLSPYSRC